MSTYPYVEMNPSPYPQNQQMTPEDMDYIRMMQEQYSQQNGRYQGEYQGEYPEEGDGYQLPYMDNDPNIQGYADGGFVQPTQLEMEQDIELSPEEAAQFEGLVGDMAEDDIDETVENSDFPLAQVAEILRNHGRYEDSVLVHLNMDEFNDLQQMYPEAMTLNPVTGLPEFFLGKIGKFLKKAVKKVGGPAGGGILGGILGNFLMPGVGGALGAIAGGAAGGNVGQKKHRAGLLGGALIGAMMPTVAGGVGSLLKSAGATGAGGAVTGFSNNASMMNLLPPSLGGTLGLEKNVPAQGGILKSIITPDAGNVAQAATSSPFSFSNWLTPQNVLAAAPLAMRAMEPTAEKTLMKQGIAEMRLSDMINSPERQLQAIRQQKQIEDAGKKLYEADEREEKQEKVRNYEQDLDNDLEEIVLSDPEYREKTGLNYRRYKGRGDKRREVSYAKGGFVNSTEDGMADTFPINVSGGEQVLRSPSVSTLGNGNSLAGARILRPFNELDEILSGVGEGAKNRMINRIKKISQSLEDMKGARHGSLS